MVRRAHRLTPLERAVLIVADGRQDFAGLLAALGRAASGAMEAAAALTRLIELGLLDIERPAPVAAAGRKSLALARLYLIESMERALRGQTDALKPLLRGPPTRRASAVRCWPARRRFWMRVRPGRPA